MYRIETKRSDKIHASITIRLLIGMHGQPFEPKTSPDLVPIEAWVRIGNGSDWTGPGRKMA
jgi:hypothetical protein